MEIGLVGIHHRSADKCLPILFVQDGQQLVGAFDALRRNFHVVVHKEDVRDLVGLESLDHAICESAGTSDIAVRKYRDAFARKRYGIECAAVVDHEHAEMPGDVFVRSKDLVAYKFDVVGDIGFLLESHCRKSELDGLDAAFRNSGGIVGIPDNG